MDFSWKLIKAMVIIYNDLNKKRKKNRINLFTPNGLRMMVMIVKPEILIWEQIRVLKPMKIWEIGKYKILKNRVI